MASSADNGLTQARSLYNRKLTAERTRQMRGLLESHAAAALTPTAEAPALLATTVLCDYLNRWNSADHTHVATAEKAVQQALAADSSHALAHYAKGFLHRTKGEHREALAAFTETTRLNPRFARAHAQRGAELVYLGRPNEGIPEVEKALALSPRSSARGMFFWIIGRARFCMGQYGDAIPWLRRSIRLWPHLWYNRLYLVSAYALLGNTAAAKRALRAFEGRFPGFTLKRVVEEEKANPSDHGFMVEGRRKFHEGLVKAGMPE
jgi:adenylate cyclase